jgi:proline dehydrogenase
MKILKEKYFEGWETLQFWFQTYQGRIEIINIEKDITTYGENMDGYRVYYME